MAYKCVHCSEVYGDGSKEVLTGCNNCGRKFFFYIKEAQLKQIQENKVTEPDLSKREKEQIEKDVRDIAGISDVDKPVFLDFESVKIVKPGSYLLDIQKLFANNAPRIYTLEDGKYIIDLASRFANQIKEKF
jgi:predicted  nucleic acid-binding Zn-ribbon protein